MGLSARQQKLLDLLSRQNDYITVNHAANALGVSERTVYSDIDDLAKYLISDNKQVKRKRGVGVKIEKINDNKSIPIPEQAGRLTVEQRRTDIFKKLLFDESTVTHDVLSEYYYVSRSSIQNDLNFINSHFIKLTSDHSGTRFSGTEDDWRNAHLIFNKKILQSKNKTCELKKFYSEDLTLHCINIVQELVAEENLKLSDIYIENMISVLITMMYRLKKGYHRRKTKENKPTKLAKNLSVFLSKKFNVGFSVGDLQYLSSYLYLNKFTADKQDFNDECKGNVDLLLNKMTGLTGIPFNKDEKLRSQLEIHFPPMMDRLLSSNIINNPFSQEIKNELIMIYNILLISIESIEYFENIEIHDNELTFIAIYFQAALERIQKEKRILVVCPMGIAASELIINRIKKFVGSGHTFVSSSHSELKKLNLSDFDLVLSTLDIDGISKKWMKVSIFITDNEIKNILSFFSRNEKESVMLDDIAKFKLSTENYEFISINKPNKRAVLTYAVNKLLEQNKVTPEFLNSVFEREKLSSTDFPSGIATPHGLMDYVRKTTIVIIKNEKKIKWDSYFVDIVFLICIAKDDSQKAKQLISELYSIIDNPAILNILRS